MTPGRTHHGLWDRRRTGRLAQILCWLAALSTSMACELTERVIGAHCPRGSSCEADAASGDRGGSATRADGGQGLLRDAGQSASRDGSPEGGAGSSPQLPALAPEGSPSFQLSLSDTGIGRLPAELDDPALAAQGIAGIPSSASAVWRLRGEDASETLFAASAGPDASPIGEGPEATGLTTPFSDGSRAVSWRGPAYRVEQPGWQTPALSGGIVELVFRAEAGATLLLERVGDALGRLALDETGQLFWRLEDGQGSVWTLKGPVMFPDSWHHCLLRLDRVGNRAGIVCNGQEGVQTDSAPAPSLQAGGSLQLGDAGSERVQLALLALWSDPTALDQAGFTRLARRRFARLTDTLASSVGDPLPEQYQRGHAAWMDMRASLDSPRRLHPVGAHWPRIPCRYDLADRRLCGYLAEPERALYLDMRDPEQWSREEVTLVTRRGDFADGTRSMSEVTASSAVGLHRLELRQRGRSARHTFSVFVRARKTARIGISAAGLGMASFDLLELRVESAPTDARIAIEDWGEGLVRCIYSYYTGGEDHDIVVHLLDQGGETSWGGAGEVSIEIGHAQIDLATSQALMPLLESRQLADSLSYRGEDGNLPRDAPLRIYGRILLPAFVRHLDAAVLNMNLNGRYEEQVNVFVTAPSGMMMFWGLTGGGTSWGFGHPLNVGDGMIHDLALSVDAPLRFRVDGQELRSERDAIPALFPVNRLEIGNSTRSSGPLQGLVGEIWLGGD